MGSVRTNMEAVLGEVAAAAAPALAGRPRANADFALVRRCQQGDREAFNTLIEQFHARVLGIVRGVLRHSADVEDVAQQVFTKIYFALGKFNFRSALSTWIYKIAVNECYDHLRKQRARRTLIFADLPSEEADRIEHYQRNRRCAAPLLDRQLEDRDLALKLLARVTPENRMLMVLKEIEGYSVSEVAEILGLNENTVKVRLFRARQSLVEALGRHRV